LSATRGFDPDNEPAGATHPASVSSWLASTLLNSGRLMSVAWNGSSLEIGAVATVPIPERAAR
jgi:hypothetical protein